MTSPRPCAAEPELWFSIRKADIAKAVKICQSCPLQTECAEYAVDNGIRWGTWGGSTEEQRRRKKRRPPKQPAKCGTSLAYWRHRSLGETCAPCEEQHIAEVEADRRRRLEREHAKGGTLTGYQLHARLKERPCELCRDANRQYCVRARKLRAAANTAA